MTCCRGHFDDVLLRGLSLKLSSLSMQPIAGPWDASSSLSRLLHPLFLYAHASARKQFLALYLPPFGDVGARCHVFAVDASRTNQLPNLGAAFARSYAEAESPSLPEEVAFEPRVEASERQAHRLIQRLLTAYRDERKGAGASLLVVHTSGSLPQLQAAMPALLELPNVLLTSVSAADPSPAPQLAPIRDRCLRRPRRTPRTCTRSSTGRRWPLAPSSVTFSASAPRSIISWSARATSMCRSATCPRSL